MEKLKSGASKEVKDKCRRCGYRLFRIIHTLEEVHITCHKCSNVALRLGKPRQLEEEMTPEQVKNYNETIIKSAEEMKNDGQN